MGHPAVIHGLGGTTDTVPHLWPHLFIYEQLDGAAGNDGNGDSASESLWIGRPGRSILPPHSIGQQSRDACGP